jgi:hypothetical protein
MKIIDLIFFLLYTGLPAGTYCNIIDNCASSANVDGGGSAQIFVNGGMDPAIFAICVDCEGGGGGWTIDPGNKISTNNRNYQQKQARHRAGRKLH